MHRVSVGFHHIFQILHHPVTNAMMYCAFWWWAEEIHYQKDWVWQQYFTDNNASKHACSMRRINVTYMLKSGSTDSWADCFLDTLINTDMEKPIADTQQYLHRWTFLKGWDQICMVTIPMHSPSRSCVSIWWPMSCTPQLTITLKDLITIDAIL